MNKWYSIILASLLLGSCAALKNSTTSGSNEEYRQNETTGISFESIDLALVQIKSGEDAEQNTELTITLKINLSESQYSGKSGCNSYFGKVESSENGTLTFDVGGVTEMLCPEDIMKWEVLFLNAVTNQTFTVLSTNKQVRLVNVADGTELLFNKQP